MQQSSTLISAPNHPMITRGKAGIQKPIQKMSLIASKYPLQVSDNIEPIYFTQAYLNPEWRHAMDDEFNTLIRD